MFPSLSIECNWKFLLHGQLSIQTYQIHRILCEYYILAIIEDWEIKTEKDRRVVANMESLVLSEHGFIR